MYNDLCRCITTDNYIKQECGIANSEATLKIKSAFQLTARQFFILGEIRIEAIEFALFHEDNKVWEDVGLGLSGLTEEEKEILKTQSPFGLPISISGSDHTPYFIS